MRIRVDTRLGDAASKARRQISLRGRSFIGASARELDFRARRVRFPDPERFAVPRSSSARGEAVLGIAALE